MVLSFASGVRHHWAHCFFPSSRCRWKALGGGGDSISVARPGTREMAQLLLLVPAPAVMSSGLGISGITFKPQMEVLSTQLFLNRAPGVVTAGWPGAGISLAGVSRQWDLPGGPSVWPVCLGKKQRL